MTSRSITVAGTFLNERSGAARRVLTIVIGALFAVLCIGYIFGSNPPFGFYYDLGVNIAATQLIDKSINSIVDLKDAIGWSAWSNGPQFTFNPMLAYGFLVPLVKIFAHDAFRAVKALQVLDTLVAFFGMRLLYASVRSKSGWSTVAGGLYAVLPLTVLQIQGNVEFGLTTALAPLALGLCLRIGGVSGAAGLPLCGAICSLAGACIAIEYFFFLTLPMYIAAALSVRERNLRWAGWSVLGLGACALAVSYCAFPTVLTRALFADPIMQTPATAQLPQYAIFSGTILSMGSLLLNEALIVDPPFNVSSEIMWALPAGIVLWAAAAWYLIRAAMRHSLPQWTYGLFAVCVICTVLAFGANMPLGTALWEFFSHVPVLAYMRTPDRFIALPAVCVVLWAVMAAEDAAAERARLRTAVAVVLALVIASLVMFAGLRHALQTEPNLLSREPDLQMANDRVAALGARNVPLAFVRNGSIYYFALYGYSAPQLLLSWDLAGRYLLDGIGGAGILGKAAVHSIVATPNWTTDGQRLPNPLSALYRSSLLSHVASSPNFVYVYKVNDGKDYVYAVEPSCYGGGPGNLDRIEGLREFRNTSIVRTAPECRRVTLSDFDPRDRWIDDARFPHWPGNLVFPTASPVNDYDYAFIQGRTFLNDPWYRNAIDGDASLLAPAGAVSLQQSTSVPIRVSLKSGRDYALNFRIACHAQAVISVRIAQAESTHGTCMRASGFQWLTVPLRAPGRSQTSITVSVSAVSLPTLPDQEWAIALDGMVLTDGTNDHGELSYGANISDVVFSATRFRSPTLHEDAPEGKMSMLAWRGLIMGVGLTANTSVAPAFTATLPRSSITYRWNGPPGVYIVTGSAWISGAGATLELTRAGTTATTQTAAYDPASVMPTTVTQQAFLKNGDPIEFKLDLPPGDPNAAASFVRAQVIPTRASSVSTDGLGSQTYLWDFVGTPSWFLKMRPNQQTDSGAGLVPNLPIDIVLHTQGFSNIPTVASLQVDASGKGLGFATLTCDGAPPVTFVLRSPDAAAGVHSAAINACTITLRLRDPDLRVQAVRLTTRASVARVREARRWLPAGDYTISGTAAGGTTLTPVLTVDGRAVGKDLALKSGGWHTIAIDGGPADLSTLLFLNRANRRQAVEQPQVSQIAAVRWKVAIRSRSTLEAAVLPDGFWRLISSHKTYDGSRCDLINTCFASVVPGDYVLIHRWAPWTLAGIGLTLAVWLFGLICAGLPYIQARRR